MFLRAPNDSSWFLIDSTWLAVEDDADLRDQYGQRARELNAEQPAQALPDPEDVAVAADQRQQLIGVGLMGMGDDSFPVSVELLTQLESKVKGFVKRGSVAWRKFIRSATNFCRQPGKIPFVKASQPCAERFCASDRSQLQEVRLNMAAGLVRNVIRHMRNERARSPPYMSEGQRHPVLIVQAGDRLYGWLAVRPSFKPLYLHAWELDLPDSISPAVKFVAKLRFEIVGRTSRLLPAMRSFDEIVYRLAATDVDLCYQLATYNLYWRSPMSNLHVEPAQWVHLNVGDVANDDSDDESDTGPDENAELDEATSLLERFESKSKGSVSSAQ